MNVVRLTLDSPAVRPGETITGEAIWELEGAPRMARVRLRWETRGRGQRDTETVAMVDFADPLATDLRRFSLSAPAFPSSFSGRLISVVWVVELAVEPEGAASEEIVIAPDGREISLERPDWITMPAPAKGWFAVGSS